MLGDMGDPCAFVFPQSPNETAGLAIGTAMLLQTGQGLDQAINKLRAELCGRPVLQNADIQHMADDSELRILVGADI